MVVRGKGGNDHRKACFKLAHPGGVPEQPLTDCGNLQIRNADEHICGGGRSGTPPGEWRLHKAIECENHWAFETFRKAK